MKKSLKISIVVLVSLVIMFFIGLILPWIIVIVEMEIQDKELSQKAIPPAPVVKYGEFPYTLEYKLNDEIVKVEDTVICEYMGINAFKQRSWNADQRYIDIYKGQYGKEYIEVSFLLPSADMYMGDSEIKVDADYIPEIKLDSTVGKNSKLLIMTLEEFLEEYDIDLEIIKFDTANSIENTF